MLTVIGEALVDLVADADRRTYVAHCGGSPLNVAVGLARLGRPTALMARLGADAFGRQLHEYATANGVDLSAAVAAEQSSTLAVVSLDEQARATYDFWIDGTADWQWSDDELDRLPESTRILHTGSLAAWTAPGGERIAARAEGLYRDGRILLTYDPNVRPRLLGTPQRGRDLVEASVRHSHVVKASDEDVHWLYPDLDADEVASHWLSLGAAFVVITAGPNGAGAYQSGAEPCRRPGLEIELVDTVGAGDAFMSGLLDALDRRGIDSPVQLDRLDPATTADVLDDAILVAAMTCERAGADPPTRARLDARLAS